MTSITFFFLFIPLLALILLAIDLIFAPHNPYQEKNSPFECGYHSFLGQNRTQFSISFFIFALLFLLFDLEILLVYPYIVSAHINSLYGLIIMLLFFLLLTLGFAFELGKNALKIDSRQIYSVIMKDIKVTNTINSNLLTTFSIKDIIFYCFILLYIIFSIFTILSSFFYFASLFVSLYNILTGKVAIGIFFNSLILFYFKEYLKKYIFKIFKVYLSNLFDYYSIYLRLFIDYPGIFLDCISLYVYHNTLSFYRRNYMCLIFIDIFLFMMLPYSPVFKYIMFVFNSSLFLSFSVLILIHINCIYIEFKSEHPVLYYLLSALCCIFLIVYIILINKSLYLLYKTLMEGGPSTGPSSTPPTNGNGSPTPGGNNNPNNVGIDPNQLKKEKNKEKWKENTKRYREKNKEKLKEKHKKYREKNKEKVKEREQKYYEKNKEEIKEKKKKYREENKEKWTENSKKYKKKKKEEIKKDLFRDLDVLDKGAIPFMPHDRQPIAEKLAKK